MGDIFILVSDTLTRKQLMNIQTGNEITSLLICFKLRSGRAILGKGLYNLSKARTPPFRQMQLLKEIANTAVPVPSADCTAVLPYLYPLKPRIFYIIS